MAISDIYSSKLENLGYSKSQITSAIEKLRSHAPTHYPYLLGAVLYFIQIRLYQQMKVSELKQGLESIIKRSKSPKLSELLHETLGALDLIIDKNLSWDNPYFWNFHSSDIYTLPNVKYLLKRLENFGYQYHILLPSKALELFLKYLSKTLTFYHIRKPSKKVIIKSLKDYLRKKIEELERYEEENLPKLLDGGVKRIIEIYEKLKPIIEEYSTYIENIEIHAKKSLNDLENEDKKRRSPHDYYFELHMIDRKSHYAAEMRNYIEGILKMLYLIGIGKVSIDEIMYSLNETEDSLLNLERTYNLLLSKQRNLFNCEIMKKDLNWCTKR
jgi:hypothetical protein